MFEHNWEHKGGVVYRCADCGIYGKDRRGDTSFVNEGYTKKAPSFIEDAVRECQKVDLTKTMTARVTLELPGCPAIEQTIEVPSFETCDEMKKMSMNGLDAEVEHCSMVTEIIKESLVRRMVGVAVTVRKRPT